MKGKICDTLRYNTEMGSISRVTELTIDEINNLR